MKREFQWHFNFLGLRCAQKLRLLINMFLFFFFAENLHQDTFGTWTKTCLFVPPPLPHTHTQLHTDKTTNILESAPPGIHLFFFVCRTKKWKKKKTGNKIKFFLLIVFFFTELWTFSTILLFIFSLYFFLKSQ